MAVRDILRYNQIARAGQPVSLTGEAVVQLGALFSQMDFDLKEEEEVVEDGQFPGRKEADKKLEEGTKVKNKELEAGNFRNILEADQKRFETDYKGQLGAGLKIPEKKIAEDKTIVKPNTMPMGTEYVFGTADARYTGPPEENDAYLTDNLKGQYRQGPGVDLDKYKQVVMPFYGPDYMPLNEDKNTVNQRKTDSPLDRIKQDQPEIYNSLQAVRYYNKGANDSPLHRAAHVAESPFVKTDNVDYRMMKRATMPGYAKGRLGAAAAEGYNLVIDKYNYDQAVKADYDEELEDQMGALQVEPDFLNEQSRKDFMDFSFGLKKELSNAFNDYSSGKISKVEYENIKSGISSRIKAVGATNTNLATVAKEYANKKGTYDIGASDKEIVDFYNTLEKSPESFTFKTIDGVDYFVGKTRQGKEVQVPASKLANGAAGFRLVEKANISPIVGGALKAMNSFQKTVKTNFGYGTANASPEKAKEIGVANIKAALASDESQLRSLMSQIYGAGYDSYQNFLGNEPEANREEMLNDAAEHLYETRVKSLYFPQEKTTRFVTQQKSQTGGTAGERTAAEIQKQINQFPSPTPENIMSDWATIIDKRKYKVQKDTKGIYFITDLKDNPISQLDFDKPQQIINTFANIAGIRGKQKLPILNK